MLGRSPRSEFLSSVVTSTQPRRRSLNHTEPLLGSKARRIRRLVVVFPQPDSPTRPRVLPLGIVKLTSSTARTWPTVRFSNPWVMGKNLRSSRTSNRLLSPLPPPPLPPGFAQEEAVGDL